MSNDDDEPGTPEQKRFKAAMHLAAYYSSWNEIIDTDKLRKKVGNKTTDDMFEAYDKGKTTATEVLGTLNECIRTDTEEGVDNRKFFDELLGEAVEMEMPEVLRDVGAKPKRRRKKKATVNQSGTSDNT